MGLDLLSFFEKLHLFSFVSPRKTSILSMTDTSCRDLLNDPAADVMWKRWAIKLLSLEFKDWFGWPGWSPPGTLSDLRKRDGHTICIQSRCVLSWSSIYEVIQLHLERLKVAGLWHYNVLLQKNWREFFVLGAREMPTVVQGELNLKHFGSYAAASQKYTFVVFSFLRFLLQAMPSSSRQR